MTIDSPDVASSLLSRGLLPLDMEALLAILVMRYEGHSELFRTGLGMCDTIRCFIYFLPFFYNRYRLIGQKKTSGAAQGRLEI